jgi:hypothetical protein
MTISEAKQFLTGLCGDDSFGKQLQDECFGRIFEVGYPISKGDFGARSTVFVNDFNHNSLTNHYKKILRSYE